MRLTRFSDYGVRMLAYLGQRPGERASIPEIAQVHGLSAHHLGKVAHALGQAGYLRTIRGHGGGVELARSPELIGLGDVVRRLEPIAVLGADPTALAGAVGRAMSAFLSALDGYTIRDLIAAADGDEVRPAPPSKRRRLPAARKRRFASPREP